MEDFHRLSQQNKTLLLTAVNVTKEKASGCYQCQCGSGEVKEEMYFSVQVGLPGIYEHLKLTRATTQA